MKKSVVYMLILILLFSFNPVPPTYSAATDTNSDDKDTEEIVLFSEQADEQIAFYENEKGIEEDEPSLEVPDESSALLILTEPILEKEDNSFVLVRYEYSGDAEEIETVEGYVNIEHIVPAEDADEYRENRKESEEDSEGSSDDGDNDSENQESSNLEEEKDADDSEENSPASDKDDSDENESDTGKDNNQEEKDDSEDLKEKEESSQPQASFFTRSIQESKTSKLARIKNSNVKIYESIGGKSITAGSKYMDAVYYVKKQAKSGSDTYYLLSTKPSATKGLIGWVQSKDLSSHSHKGVDKDSKTLYINGDGKARSKAWGDTKDYVYEDLSKYTGETFKVNLTEKVGKNTWYRGVLDGKTVWLHSSSISLAKESKTSKLARMKNKNVKIYDSIGGSSSTAGSKNTGKVYYVKKQAKSGNDTYYLLSTEPSATKGVLGWVKKKDLSSHSHKGVDKESKTLYVKGKGKARLKAWGDKKDYVYEDLSKYTGETFKVNLTEKVGKNTWYRGVLDGKTVWLHSSSISHAKESKTSKLARIKNKNVKIYDSIGGSSSTAGSKNTDMVYYVKGQAKSGNDTYYLLSTEPSSTKGVLGWIKKKDLSSHSHEVVDKESKTLYVKGKGKARSKAWGDKKDYVYEDLSKYAGETFKVNLTEKVGENTWYRGKLDGKTVWLHSSSISHKKESKTSKLARIKSSKVKIYESINGNSFSAGSEYTDAVYYVKKEAKVDNDSYYLLSTKPSSTKGVVGWVRSKDLSSHPHKGVDKKSKTFSIKGDGNARSKAWGAKKDIEYSSLSKYKNEQFKVNLTEKVGNNIWHRGKLNGKTVWIHSKFLSSGKKTIVIDPGHGGKDPGASSNGLVEKNIALDISKKVAKKLRSEDYTVIMTRTKDETVELSDRTNIANSAEADLFMSIHVNSGGGKGIETWWYEKGHNPKESKKLATVVQEEVIKETKANNRGIKDGNLHVNRESKMPSSLVEVGFIDDVSEANKLKQNKYKEKISKGIVNGIKKYF